MTWTARLGAWALAAALIFGAGMLTGWKLWSPNAPAPETYAREIRQGDGSLVLERKPQADARPAQEIPKGAALERVVQVTVQPRRESAAATPRISGSDHGAEPGKPGPEAPMEPGKPVTIPPCPPVRVDLSLVRMPDQTRRVVVSSPDGDVVGGVDIPVETPEEPRRLHWAAGAIWNPVDRTYGAFLDRDMGPIRMGAEIFQQFSPTGTTWAGHLRLGIRF